MNLTRPAIKLLLVLGFGLQFGSAVALADTSYTVNTTIVSTNPTGTLQNDSIVGTIVTDGATVIGSSDIVSYNLDLIDNMNPANDIDLTSANSTVVEDVGGDLIATASGISFNFANPGEVLFQANTPGPFSGFSYFCFSTGLFACFDGETISPGQISADGAVLTGAAAPSGITGLNQNPTSTVPEPSSLALMLAGLVIMAISANSKKLIGRSAVC